MTLTHLVEQAEVLLMYSLGNRKGEIFAMEETEALSEINDEIGKAIDECLNEKSDTYTQTLLLCCLESPNLFLREPQSISCIVENGTPGEVNAQHCVYHNLYDYLRETLEHEADKWYQTKEVKV